MKWKQVDEYHLVSDCGRYRVSRVTTGRGYWYDGWCGTSTSNSKNQSSEMAKHIYGSKDKRTVIRAIETYDEKTKQRSAA